MLDLHQKEWVQNAEKTIQSLKQLDKFEILSDPETMRHYPKPFDENRTKD